jgi:hypothetical protein
MRGRRDEKIHFKANKEMLNFKARALYSEEKMIKIL